MGKNQGVGGAVSKDEATESKEREVCIFENLHFNV